MLPPAGILADNIDPKTGEYRSIARGMDPIDAQVVDALKIRRASGAAVADDGQDFATIKKNDETTPVIIDSKTRRAVSRLSEAGHIRVLAVDVEADPNGDTGATYLRYQNLRARGRQDRSERILR